MRLPKIHSVEHRIGVIGLYRAGKTVFLTSLINHLQNHDPRILPVGKAQTRIHRWAAVALWVIVVLLIWIVWRFA